MEKKEHCKKSFVKNEKTKRDNCPDSSGNWLIFPLYWLFRQLQLTDQKTRKFNEKSSTKFNFFSQTKWVQSLRLNVWQFLRCCFSQFRKGPISGNKHIHYAAQYHQLLSLLHLLFSPISTASSSFSSSSSPPSSASLIFVWPLAAATTSNTTDVTNVLNCQHACKGGKQYCDSQFYYWQCCWRSLSKLPTVHNLNKSQ